MSISKSKRTRVYSRDSWKCQYCGDCVTETTASIDHAIPTVDGGSNCESNLLTCCKKCNSVKGKRSIEWLRNHLGILASPYANVINVQTYFALIKAGAVLAPLPKVIFAFEDVR